MKRIETEYWKPHPEKPRYVVYDRGRPVQEVYSELRARLEASGYLPDEYFMLGRDWENGRLWPRDGDIFCAVDYGGSEGIYLDVYLKYKDGSGKMRTDSFITGKTLGESGGDMDRMYLIASAVTKAFHSDGVHARYSTVNGEQQPEEGAVVHLNPEERKLVAGSLLTARVKLKDEHKPFEAAERLLRRVIGSVTEYVKAVGECSDWLDGYDRAVLAIADGDADTFRAVLPGVRHEYGGLLELAAARPGAEGFEMTEAICSAAENINYETYLRACKNAVDINDEERVLLLLSKAETCAANVEPGFYGEIIIRALSGGEANGGRKDKLAASIAGACNQEQIQGANPGLLRAALIHNNSALANALLDRGFPVTENPAALLYLAAQNMDISSAEKLIRAGAEINAQSSAALGCAMRANDRAAGMFLLRLGADFEDFSNEVIGRNSKPTDEERGFMLALKNYYESSIKAPEAETGSQALPVGRIDFLGTNGITGESVEYTDAAKLEADIKRENFYGAPMTVTLYRNADGSAVPHGFIFETDPPLRGFHISDSPETREQGAEDNFMDDEEDGMEM